MTHPSATKMFARALLRHCPWCGRGKLFPRWFKPRRRCPQCGLVIERGEGAMLGSMSINLGVAMVAVIVFAVAWLILDAPDIDIPRAILATAAVGVVVPTLFFPFAKLIWAAIDVIMHSYDISYVDPDEGRRLKHGE